MINYVTINPATNTAIAFDVYDGMNWATFKADFESANPGLELVDTAGSIFPSGQNWYSGVGLYQRLPYEGNGAFAVIQAKLLNNISLRTEEIQYSGTVTFKGEQFPRTHDTRGDVVLLATAAGSSAAMAAALLPLRVNSISMEEVTIDNVTEANDFALAMLNPLKAVYAGQADQIAAVQAMTTITQLIQYIDPR